MWDLTLEVYEKEINPILTRVTLNFLSTLLKTSSAHCYATKWASSSDGLKESTQSVLRPFRERMDLEVDVLRREQSPPVTKCPEKSRGKEIPWKIFGIFGSIYLYG